MPVCLFFCAASAYLTSENLNADISNHDSVEKKVNKFLNLQMQKLKRQTYDVQFALGVLWIQSGELLLEFYGGIKAAKVSCKFE